MTTMTVGLHPGARLLYYVLRDLAGDDGRVMVASSELLRRTGWANRTTLRRRTHELENAGVVSIERTTRPDGGRGPKVFTLSGDDHR